MRLPSTKFKPCMLAGFLAIPFNVGMFGFIYILSAFRKHKAAATPQCLPSLAVRRSDILRMRAKSRRGIDGIWHGGEGCSVLFGNACAHMQAAYEMLYAAVVTGASLLVHSCRRCMRIRPLRMGKPLNSSADMGQLS